MYARDLEFWQLVERGMSRAANELGVELNVELSNRSLQTESQLVDSMYARGDNVLVMAPYDTTASAAALRRAQQRGMTIVQYDSRVEDEGFHHFVGVDQRQLGELLGSATQAYLDEHMGGTATFALLTGETEPNGPPRREEFLAAAPGAKVVTRAEAVGDPPAGAKAFETVMQSHPDIDAVFAWNGAALQGAMTAARRMQTDVKIFGIDQSEIVANAMKSPNSNVAIVADQRADEVGYRAVKVGVKLAQGQEVKNVTEVTPTLYQAGDEKTLGRYLAELSGGVN